MLSLINVTAGGLIRPWHVTPVAPQRQSWAALLECTSALQMAGNKILVLQTPAHFPLIHPGIVLLIYWLIYRCSNKSQNPSKNITRGRDLERTKLRWRQSQEPRWGVNASTAPQRVPLLDLSAGQRQLPPSATSTELTDSSSLPSASPQESPVKASAHMGMLQSARNSELFWQRIK